MKTFAENWSEVRAGLAAAARQSGRRLGDVELVAVSKGHSAETIQQAVVAGQLLFGESRVQEIQAKATAIPGVRWHFIGHLQKNKVRPALPLCEMIQSVDSLELARAISRIAGETQTRCRVLLEVNIGGEASKHGFSPTALPEQLEALLALEHLQIEGLMAIPPYAESAELSRPSFVRLRALRDQLQTESGLLLPTLSMGMSNDYAVAVEEGATVVRVGTALFGER